MVNAWAVDYNTARTLRSASDAGEGWMLYAVFMLVIALFLLLPGSLLDSVGWSYFGGGPGFEKIHPATYLLVAVFSWLLVFNPSFRWRCIAYAASDLAFIAFLLAVFAALLFAIVFNGASSSNFIDTFIVALIVRTAIVAIPRRPMTQFRSFIDVYCVVTIVVVFAEYTLHRNFVSQTMSNAPTSLINLYDISPTHADFRSTGLFDHPLAAAGFLSLYSILNFVATPVRLSRASIARMLIGSLAFIAIFPTGGRAALVISALIISLYIGWSALRSIATGSLNKAGLVIFVSFMTLFLLMIPIMQQLGVFDVMLRRFEYDSGSAASRVDALQILLDMRMEDLWFGLSQQDAINLQNDYGMVAIENTWVNFSLASGLILTGGLLVTYALYLFVSNPRYCTGGIYYIAILQFILANSSNGLWTKSTTLGVFTAVIFCFLRKDMFPPSRRQALTTQRAVVYA